MFGKKSNGEKCICNEWKRSEPSIRKQQQFAAINGTKYTGAEWKFCPWCGKVKPDV